MNARLIPLTPQTELAIGGRDMLEITIYPYRLGRECRDRDRRQPMASSNRRLRAAPLNNECYLLDWGTPTHISREHLQIERDADHTYFAVDRGSACGSTVDGIEIGRHRTTSFVVLHSGMAIHLGTRTTPYRFQFELA
jgi:hypothetical protein